MSASRNTILAAIALVLATLLIATYIFNPVKAVDDASGPVARSVGIVEGRCHDGWEDISDSGDHAKAFVCAKGSWRVSLKPDGKTFSHAVELDKPGAEIVYDETAVPGW